MYDRIKLLRTEELHMTQTEFGEALGVKRDVINNIENNRLKNPEKQEPIYRLMCEKFNVSEEWLRTGEGEMFAEVPAEDEYFKAVTQISKSNDKLAMQAIIEYWKLDDVSKETLRNYIYKIAEKSRE